MVQAPGSGRESADDGRSGAVSNGGFPGDMGHEGYVTTKDGREYSKRVDHAKGDPGNPLTAQEVLGKYADCASKVLNAGKVP